MLGGHKQEWGSKAWNPTPGVIKKYIWCKSLHQTKNLIVTLTGILAWTKKPQVPRTPVKSTTVRSIDSSIDSSCLMFWVFNFWFFLQCTHQDLPLEIIAMQNAPKGTGTNWVESPNQWQKLVELKATYVGTTYQSDAWLLKTLTPFMF